MGLRISTTITFVKRYTDEQLFQKTELEAQLQKLEDEATESRKHRQLEQDRLDKQDLKRLVPAEGIKIYTFLDKVPYAPSTETYKTDGVHVWLQGDRRHKMSIEEFVLLDREEDKKRESVLKYLADSLLFFRTTLSVLSYDCGLEVKDLNYVIGEYAFELHVSEAVRSYPQQGYHMGPN